MLIGLTGQIGAGKTTAAEILSSFGAHVVDADRIGRRVVEDSPALLAELVRQFGDEILTLSGRLSRVRLAQKAFADPESKAMLDRLVHPHLLRELRREVFRLGKRHDIIVIDAALLLDWGMDREVNFVLVIHATLSRRIARLSRRGLRKADILARQNTQLPYSEYRRRAHRVILNNGTRAQLKAKLNGLWIRLTREGK